MATPSRDYARTAVPRYTSYPTAPHFRRPFAADEYRDWLSRLDPAEPISIYLHVPFCRRMCWYCGCNMKLAARYGPLETYVADLRAEIALIAGLLPARMRISHLHWGGGTPTALSPEDLGILMSDLRDKFDFDADAELAIESDPRTLTPAMTETIGRLGFTRASFGVQEFDPRVQTAINRVQPPEMVAECVAGLRAAGVAGINFDLIYGLPYQTTETLLATIEACGPMRPDRIALFGYAHVPWMAKNQRMIPEEALPDAAARADQVDRAAQALAQAGYETIGLDHFALPDDSLSQAARAGRLRRNFQGYTTDAAQCLLGLGATSIGRTPHGYVQNIAETGAWAHAVRQGRLPVAKGLSLSNDDRLRAEVIERIMCDGAVDPVDIGAKHGMGSDWCEDELARLQVLARDGLVSRRGTTISLTTEGLKLRRVVASVFDAYLGASEARHSVAV